MAETPIIDRDDITIGVSLDRRPFTDWVINIVDGPGGTFLRDYEPVFRTGFKALCDEEEPASKGAQTSRECELFSLLRKDGDDSRMDYQLIIWPNGQARVQSQIPAVTRIDITGKRIFITIFDPDHPENRSF